MTVLKCYRLISYLSVLICPISQLIIKVGRPHKVRPSAFGGKANLHLFNVTSFMPELFLSA